MFTGAYRYSNFVGNVPGFFDLNSTEVGAKYTYALDRHVNLRVGYTYRNTQVSRLLRPIEHDLDIGVDYTRPLSRTRRSQIGFSIGPTMVDGAIAPTDPEAATRHYRLIGDAFFERQMSRTWRARASYRRGIAYIEGLSGPVFNDGASVETGGFLNHRMDLTFSASAALGKMAAQKQAATFTTYTGNARLRVGLTSQWAVYLEGVVYEYTFDRALLLAPGLPTHLNRNSIRAGFTLRVPVRSR